MPTYEVLFSVDAGIKRRIEAKTLKDAKRKAQDMRGKECVREVLEVFIGKVLYIEEVVNNA